MRRFTQVLLILAAAACPQHARTQAAVEGPRESIRVCPGAFPTDLTSTDCRYTSRQRSLDFVSGSVTDQAVLSAVVFGLGAQVINSPADWGRTWHGYGDRVGSRYTQAVGKGAGQYVFGLLMKDDPRFLAYRNDPAVIARHRDAVALNVNNAAGLTSSAGIRSAGTLDAVSHDGWKRFGHAWYDVITVRRSSVSGDGRRIPAVSRFAGEIGGAYAGYPWYHGAENTFPQVGQRAAGAFGTAVLSSFFTEYKPEISNLLGALLRRGKQSKSSTGVKP